MTMTWIKICNSEFDTMAPKTGLYVFACCYNNHFAFELYRLNENEKLWKYFVGEFEHLDGNYKIFPIAYHYVDFYSAIPNSHWELSPDFAEESVKYSVWAYSRNDSNIEYALRCGIPAIYPESVYKNRKFLDTLYDEDYWKDTNFIGFHKFSRLSLKDL